MKRLAAWGGVVLVLAARAAALADPAPAAVVPAPAGPRVRLLVPTLPDLTELAVLTRAELVAGGFVVEHRAVPAGPLGAWLDEARRDGVLAVVGIEPAPAEVRLWLMDGAGVPVPRTLIEPVPLSGPGATEAAASRARTTLALRIAERIREHRAGLAARSAPAGSAPPATAPMPLQLEALLLAGRALHPTALALGLELGLTRPLGRLGLLRLAFTARGASAPLAAPGGTARPYETALLAGLALAPAWGRFTPELGLGLGAQHTLVVGRGAAGFEGHTEGSLSGVLAARVGGRLALHPRLALVLAARAWQLLPAPVVSIDEVTVSRAGPGLEAGLGLAFGY